MTILIIEESEQMRRTLKTFVGDLADSVHECGDGKEALTAYERHRPDWVLMDIDMSDVDGIGATRQIKANYPEARVVILTAYDDDELREAARGAGACEYVVKENLLDLCRLLINPDQRHLSGN